jgi:hypothetical protein
MGSSRITILSEGYPTVYKILPTPGRYPVKGEPGYEVINHCGCEKET